MGEDHLQEARRALGGAFYGIKICSSFDNIFYCILPKLPSQLVPGDILTLLVKYVLSS